MQTFSQLYYNLTTLPNHNINGFCWIDFTACWVLLLWAAYEVVMPIYKLIKKY